MERGKEGEEMLDCHQRSVDYLRVSVTDRCNLRCRYCMPEEISGIPHERILRYEEIVRICSLASDLGIRNIKVTGGEPLVRLNCMDLLRELKRLPKIEHVTITTNGVLLREHLKEMKDIGIDGINISLDTLDPNRYKQITGRDEFSRVWGALKEALRLEMRVKLNCVPVKQFNEAELLSIADLAAEYPLQVRFIEMMPIGYGKIFEPVKGNEILMRLRDKYPLIHEDRVKRGFGPAQYYREDSWSGSVGFIDAMTDCFCPKCNRIRLTSEGFLKPCLYHETGTDLRMMLRSGIDDATIRQAMEKQIYVKPVRHEFKNGAAPEESRVMSQIGG